MDNPYDLSLDARIARLERRPYGESVSETFVDSGDQTLGVGFGAVAAALLPATSTTLASVTASFNGGVICVDASCMFLNGNSGAYRAATFFVEEDGVTVGQVIGDVAIPFSTSNNPHITPRIMFTRRVTAGSYTWRLRSAASTSSAIYYINPALKVTHIKGLD